MAATASISGTLGSLASPVMGLSIFSGSADPPPNYERGADGYQDPRQRVLGPACPQRVRCDAALPRPRGADTWSAWSYDSAHQRNSKTSEPSTSPDSNNRRPVGIAEAVLQNDDLDPAPPAPLQQQRLAAVPGGHAPAPGVPAMPPELSRRRPGTPAAVAHRPPPPVAGPCPCPPTPPSSRGTPRPLRWPPSALPPDRPRGPRRTPDELASPWSPGRWPPAAAGIPIAIVPRARPAAARWRPALAWPRRPRLRPAALPRRPVLRRVPHQCTARANQPPPPRSPGATYPRRRAPWQCVTQPP
mmetsp:Transcript_31740/g.51523  ORF Transcript_31740/g.51523 Transcript_31740/m.51523 type:complete len:301 (+) Transcript_31740:331-1233(+)